MSVISFAFLSGQAFTWMIAAAHAWIVSGLTKKNAVAQHFLFIIIQKPARGQYGAGARMVLPISGLCPFSCFCIAVRPAVG